MVRGHIRQRSPNHPDRWTIYVYLGRDPVTNRRKYKTEVFRGTRRDADRRRTELLRDLDTGDYIEPSGLTTAEFLRTWLRDSVEVRVRQQSFVVYRRVAERHIIPVVGHIPVEKLTSQEIQSMESGFIRKGLSARTAQYCHGLLSQALKWGVRIGILRRNASDRVDAPRFQPYRSRTLNWDEVSTLLSALESAPYYSLVLIALLTGLRRSELLGLRWRDVDFDRSLVSVNHSLVELPGRVELGPTKSGRPRSVSLPSQAVDCLASLLESRPIGLDHLDGMVFCRGDGRPLRQGAVSRFFRKLVVEAGFEGFRFHDLRHTHATLLLGEGVHLKIVSERLGRAGIAITADLYSHVAPGLQEEAAVQLSERFDDLRGVDLQIDLQTV